MHLTVTDIKAAKNRIDPYINTTPILSSSLLNKWLGHEIFFKAENFQKIGAFKARGGVNTLAWLLEQGHRPKHLVANSCICGQSVWYSSNYFYGVLCL